MFEVGQLVLDLDLSAAIRAVGRHLDEDRVDPQRILDAKQIEENGVVENRCRELAMQHTGPFLEGSMTEAKRVAGSWPGPSGAKSIRRSPRAHAAVDGGAHGALEAARCGCGLIAGGARTAMVSGMDAQPIAMPISRETAPTSVVMSSAEYAVLTRELESLRSSHRSELAQQLHHVRAHGTTSDDDDRLAVLEEAAIDRARIAQLEDLVRCATVFDDDVEFDGAAGLGSMVEVADEAGRTTKYRLIGRRTSESPAREVSLGSPVGKALVGARSGDVVHVSLPNGRNRSLTVLGVSDGAGHRMTKAA
jgi:transcription elongation factor GreA